MAFDPKLHSLLPFSSHVQWEDILVQVSAENINSQRTLIADVLKVGHLSSSSQHASTRQSLFQCILRAALVSNRVCAQLLG